MASDNIIDIHNDIVIRGFETRDRDLVNAFFDGMGGESRAFFNRRDGNRAFAMRFFDGGGENNRYFLAEYRGVMVGYVFLYEMDTLVPWLGIALSDDLKGKKLGQRLIEHVINVALGENKGGILLTTHEANIRGQVLYERCGFKYMGGHTSGERLYLLRFPTREH